MSGMSEQRSVLADKSGHGSSAGDNLDVAVTITGAQTTIAFVNGSYTMLTLPLNGKPQYQQLQDNKENLNNVLITYANDNGKNRWVISSNTNQFPGILYIDCIENNCDFASLSGKKDWKIVNDDGYVSSVDDMVATVSSEPLPAAASSAPAASAALAEAAKVLTPDPTRLAVREIPTIEEMKKVVADIEKEYGDVSTEYAKLSPESSELDWTNFETTILTPANSKLVEASSQLEAYKKPKGVDATSLLESGKKQYETLLSILKNIPDMKLECEKNTNFITASAFLVLAKKAINNSELLKDVINTSLLDSSHFLTEQDASSTNAVTMKRFITGIITHSIFQNLSGATITEQQAAAAAAAEQKINEYSPPTPDQIKRSAPVVAATKIQCKLYQTVLDTISSFPLDDKSSESLRDILNKIIEYMSKDNFKTVLEYKWNEVDKTSGIAGGSSSSKSKKNKKSYKSHKSYHPKIGKTRKRHNTHNKPKRVSFVHQA